MKTIRFGDLVRDSGRPRTVTLWAKPQDDPLLNGAIKKNRIITVVQENGKKDHGLVGFRLLPGALYLEFPRPLPRDEEARVIGINYQLIDEPTVPEKDRAKPAKPPPTHKKPENLLLLPTVHKKPAEPPSPAEPVVLKPKPQEFIVRVRRTATIEDEIKVKALDQPAAEQLALERAKHKAFKPRKAVRAEVVEAEER
jgi:hypothetical protein